MKIRKIANYSTGISSDSLPIGSIIPFSSNSIPSNYLLCDGSAISRKQYKQLFDIIGVTYGAGDGSTTFNLPDLKGKVITGLNSEDEDFNTLGKIGGEKEHTLTIDEMPKHNHGLAGYRATTADATAQDKRPRMYSQGSGSGWDGGNSVQFKGGDQPHNNLQPYIVTNYIIKAFDDINVNGEVLNQQSNSQKDTYSCDYINKKSKYSTEEQIVGEWIDGKPLYRKVYTSYNVDESSTIDTYTIDIDITKNIHNGYGEIFADSYKVNIGTGDAGFGTISNVQQNPSGQIYISRTHGAFGKINGLEIILEYTKTTD